MSKFLKVVLMCLSICVSTYFPTEHAHAAEPTRNPNAPAHNAGDPQTLTKEHLIASSCLLMNITTNESVFEKNADAPIPSPIPAVLITSILALQHGNLEDTLIVSESAVNLPENASAIRLSAGDELTLETALHGLLMQSGCDAANAIAEHIAGDIPSFVKMMNEEAERLGCTVTRFSSLFSDGESVDSTTARELYLVFSAALQYPELRDMIQLQQTTNPTNQTQYMETTNRHIRTNDRYYYPNAVGGKVGYLPEGGYSFVELAKKEDREQVVVLLYTSKYGCWSEAAMLLEYGFAMR